MSKFKTLLLSVLLSLLSFTNVVLAEEVFEFESYQDRERLMSLVDGADIDADWLVGPVIILTPVGVGSD
jgi:hypothetical protein